MKIGIFQKKDLTIEKCEELNKVLEHIGPDVTIIFDTPIRKAAISIEEFDNCIIGLADFVELNPEELEVIEVSGTLHLSDGTTRTNTKYKPFLKDKKFEFAKYKTKEEAEAACQRIKDAILFFRGEEPKEGKKNVN